jgi:hypothetical protein
MGYEYDRTDPAPPPGWLAAYADGELAPPDAARVEAWLDEHPEAAAEVEAMYRLARAWEETAAPEPSPDAWERARDRIEATTAAPPRRPFARALPAAAAAALLAILVGRGLRPGVPDVPDESLPVAGGGDVTILSMDGTDAGALVIGQPPVAGPLDLASGGDVQMLKAEPPGAVPAVWKDGDSPLLLVPRKPGRAP